MCAKPELSPSGVKEAPCLAGLGGRARGTQSALLETCWTDTRGRGGAEGGTLLAVEGEDVYLATHDPVGHEKADLLAV